MKLNERLKMIADSIPKCDILVDIGTDHAYIPIYAVENGLCSKALASDIREGPLKIAAANIKRRRLEKYIETRLGNGLEPIFPHECDTVVIAGMGGTLIRDILSDSLKKSQTVNLLLLQPNNAADVLRKWLYENGFEIIEELLAADAGRLYCMMSSKWTGRVTLKDEFEYYAGIKLLESHDPLLGKYIEKKIKELDVIISGRLKSKVKNRSDGSCHGTAILSGKSLISGISTEKCIAMRDRFAEYLGKMK